MKSAARLVAARVERVGARFVFSDSKRRSLEAETVPLIFGAARGEHVRARKVCHGRTDETPVNVKLHFDALGRRGFVGDPTVDMLRRGFIQRAAKERVEGRQIERDGERSDEQRFEN